jgi:hypothetical protein
MESVRANYDVPAFRGHEVLWLGESRPVPAQIISSTGSHLYLRAIGSGRRIGPCHPCWRIDYQDGRGDRTGQPTPMDRARFDA